jgi:hypothetical protein
VSLSLNSDLDLPEGVKPLMCFCDTFRDIF